MSKTVIGYVFKDFYSFILRLKDLLAMARDGEEVRSPEVTVDSNRGQSRDPPSARYLARPDTDYTCYFLVGDPELGPPERIGGCRLHLMAHSRVMRRMLGESELAETGDVPLPDILPQPFRHVLRFVNGHKDLRYLTVEEAVDMVYIAEKYLMEELKKALAERIICELNTDTVLTLLQRPECLQQPALKAAIDKLVQRETKALVAKPGFVELNTCGLLSIVKQETLNVTEVELWRAVLKWARHNERLEDGVTVSSLLKEPLKHMRLCTLTMTDFTGDVVLAEVLTDREVHKIVRAITTNTKQEDLTSVSNCVTKRTLDQAEPVSRQFNVVMSFDMFLVKNGKPGSSLSSSYFLVTHEKPVELLHMTLPACVHNWDFVPSGLKYKCRCFVSVWRITDYVNNTSSQNPLEFVFCKDVEFGKDFTIPFKARGKLVRLAANSKFRVKLSFNLDHPYFRESWADLGDVLSVTVESQKVFKGFSHSFGHVREIAFKVAPK